MKIGILGSGGVGQSIGLKLVELGHQVTLGTRSPGALDEAKGQAGTLRDWLNRAGAAQSGGLGHSEGGGRVATFAGATQGTELLINATSGTGSLQALELAGAAGLQGVILIDVSNPLDFSQGMPPTLFVKDTDSLGEQIQRSYPGLRVVKTLNTMGADVMVNPGLVAGGEHTVFMSGNDAAAKTQVADLLGSFGWRDILDLGDLSTARGTELLLPLWLRTWQALGTPNFQFKIAR